MGVNVRHMLGGLLSAAYFVFIPHAVLADTRYYVEIGQEVTEEEAVLQWKSYSEKYSDILKGLDFHPVTVIHQNDRSVGTRVQAGPLPTKFDAYSICGKLFDDKVPCFIVEGAEKIERPHASGGQATIVLPWMQQAENNTGSQPVPVEISEATKDDEDTGFFSWIFGDDDDDLKSSKAKEDAANKEGEVEVSEAINVPVTVNATPQYTAKPTFIDQSKPEPIPAPVIKPLEQRMAEASSGAWQASGSVWLAIKSFASEEDATAFWQDVRSAEPAQTAGYRVRLVQPYMADERKKLVSINVGPFAEQGDAGSFCQNIIQKMNSSLACEFSSTEQDMERSRLVTPRFEHSKRYERRRRMHRSRYNQREASLLSEQNRTKIYWVQVAVAESQMEALKTWDELREEHPDLLEGLRSSVSATMMRGSKYMVRVGPLESGSAATELCTSLTGRGVPCRIYSNM